MRLTAEEFFARGVRRGECLEWPGKPRGGYGRHGQRGVHVIAWELTHGPVPEGMCVLHRCDNRICFDPDHLFVGTKGDNARGMGRKGRAPIQVHGWEHIFGSRPRVVADGERNNNAKLTQADVDELRRLREAGWTKQRLAERFNIHPSTAYRIATRRRWSQSES